MGTLTLKRTTTSINKTSPEGEPTERQRAIRRQINERKRQEAERQFNTAVSLLHNTRWPLAIGVHKTPPPNVSKTVWRKALTYVCRWGRYQEALTRAEHRYDLDGALAGTVTEAQKAVAREHLRQDSSR